MKNKKWLLIVVGFIFLVNLAYFMFTRSGKVDLWVQDKVIQQLEAQLDADVAFEYFTFNDRQLNVSGITISEADGDYKISLKQVFVEYNLLELIVSNFKDLRTIKSIKIYEPEIFYNYKYETGKSGTNDSTSGNPLDIEIPDFRKFFKNLEVYDGKVSIDLDFGVVQFENSWQDIDITLLNDKDLTAEINALSSKSIWNAKALIKDRSLEELHLDLTDFFVDNLKFKGLDSLEFHLDGSLNVKKNDLDYSFGMSKLQINKDIYKLDADLINIAGNVDTMLVDFTDLYVDDNSVFAQLDLIKPFYSNPSIKGKIIATDISLNHYINQVNGLIDTELDLTGSLTNPVVKAEVETTGLSVAGQQIDQVELLAEYRDSELNFQVENAEYLGNKISGSGSWNSRNGVEAEIKSGMFQYHSGDIYAVGDLLGQLNYKDRVQSNLTVANLNLMYKDYSVPNLTLNASLDNNDVNLLISNKAKSLNIEGRGNIAEKELDTRLKFKRFNPNYIVGSRILPLTSGYLNLKLNREKFTAISSVRLFDQNYGKLDGRFNTNFTLNFTNKTSLLRIRSKNAKFNYEDIKFELLARGSLDSLRTQKFEINDEIKLQSWVKLNPQLSYGFSAEGKKIKLKDYALYFSDSYTASNLEGWTDFDLNYCSSDCSVVGGYLNVTDLEYEGLMPLDLNLKLSGDDDKILVDGMRVYSSDELITNVTGNFSLLPEMKANLQGDIVAFPLENFLPKSDGNILGDFVVNWDGREYDFGVNLLGDHVRLSGVDFDNIDLNFNQNDSLLTIHRLEASRKDLFELEAGGRLRVNAFTSEYLSESNLNSSDTLSVKFTGDILKLLEQNVTEFSSGNSDCSFNLSVGVDDGGLFARKGSFVLKKGEAKFESQPSEIRDIKINLQIKDNELDIQKFSLKAGEGKLSILNEIGNSELDLYLANLNVGAILLRTNDAGILFHMPGYMPQNSQVKVVLQGRDAQYATLTGPLDEMRITADMHLSNGDAIYPPNTENIFRIFNRINRQTKSSKPTILPFELDLHLLFGENIRYVTYPTDLKVASGSYLNLQYIDEKFIVPDALFSCYEGSVDILGTTLEAEQIQVNINQSIEGVKIVGEFQKAAADGTIISLIVRRDEEQGSVDDYIQDKDSNNGSSYGSTGNYENKIVDLEFRSDNSSDSMLDILSLLRYGRRSDELTDSQTGTLLQDEVIQLAGVGIESAFLDPLISPLENWVRKALHLDYFRLQTDIIQNIFSSYSSSNSSEEATLLEEEENDDLSKFDTDMFLNNLSVNMGRYITRTVFLDYEAQVTKQNEYIAKSKIGVYHYFTVRYNLPWKLKLSYEYTIEPFDEENSHQLQLQRTFHFY